MPTKNMRTDDAVTEFLTYLDTMYPLAEGTMHHKRRTLRALVKTVGAATVTYRLKEADFVRTVECLKAGATPEENEARRLKAMPGITGRGPGAIKMDVATLKQFIEWGKRNGYLPHVANYLSPVTRARKEETDREHEVRNQATAVDFYVPVADWPRVLEHAGMRHARTRMVAALGLFGGRRVSELRLIKIEHVNLLTEEIAVRNVKAGRPFTMAISAPLEQELKTYLRWYADTYGSLQPDWYLVPARATATTVFQNKEIRTAAVTDTRCWPMVPGRQPGNQDLIKDAQFALEAMGWGDIRGLGVHTFRRSHVVALDEQRQIEIASTSANHTSVTTTRRYYASDDTAQRRYFDAFKGKDPFGLPGEGEGGAEATNVVNLSSYRKHAG